MGVLLSVLLRTSDSIIDIMKMNEIILSAMVAMMKPAAEASMVFPKPRGLGSFCAVGVVSMIFECFFVAE